MLDRRRCRDRRGHHPWLFAGRYLPEWHIEITPDVPDGAAGLTLFRERRVLLHADLDQAGRRSTLAHEEGHILRGPKPAAHELYEEALVERQAARLLMPSVRRIGHALAWCQADHEKAAHDLWVDDRLFSVRLSTLAPAERRWLDDQLATILI